MISDTTIAAVSTAPGEAGIAVVRVSGPDAFAAVDALCPNAKVPPSALAANSFRLYRLRDRAGAVIDEALVLAFRAPHSYTGEDVAEIQVHGGRRSAARVLEALFASGAVPAEPGEFTRRAFLNGRIGLEQAEAAMDIIRARSDRAARAAAEQLGGALGRRVNALYDDIVALCADVEATLDFSDEDISGAVRAPDVESRAAALLAALAELRRTSREGQLLREGALVVLSGPVNAGKSTLFNALLGRDRAIVNAAPGTTRDSLEETLLIDGIPLRLVDTAGLRETGDEIEGEGISRARALAERADIRLELRECGDAAAESAGGIVVFTKSDLHPEFAAPEGTYRVSAATGDGLDALRAGILDALGAGERGGDDSVPVSERHAASIDEAVAHLEEARGLYAAGAECEAVVIASHLRDAAEALGRITGRSYSEDLLNTVFGRFCVGK